MHDLVADLILEAYLAFESVAVAVVAAAAGEVVVAEVVAAGESGWVDVGSVVASLVL